MKASFHFLKMISVFLISSMISALYAQPLPGTTRIVEVKGMDMRVMTAGFEHIKQGVPVVVLESGAGTEITNWGIVFTELARFAPVVAYERGGIEESEWDRQPPTPERITNQLQAKMSIKQ